MLEQSLQRYVLFVKGTYTDSIVAFCIPFFTKVWVQFTSTKWWSRTNNAVKFMEWIVSWNQAPVLRENIKQEVQTSKLIRDFQIVHA